MNPITIQEAINDRSFTSSRADKIVADVSALLDRVCPELTRFVTSSEFLSVRTVYVTLSTSGNTINRVQGEYPNKVVLMIDPISLELKAHSNRIFRLIDPNKPSERFYVYQKVIVPFKAVRGWDNIMNALERFVYNYKKTMFENLDLLPHDDICDYPTIFGKHPDYIKRLKSMCAELRASGYYEDRLADSHFFRNGKEYVLLSNNSKRLYVWKSFYDAHGCNTQPKIYECKDDSKVYMDAKGKQFINSNMYLNELIGRFCKVDCRQ